jgi:hypothetical protein
MCDALAEDAELSALSGRSAALVARRPLYPGLPAFPDFGS